MKKIFTIILLSFVALSGQAQKQLQIGDIDMINLGDGRLFARDGLSKKAKPIDGRVRIITGYTTEYIDAGFDKGYADGKWEYYRYNVLSESRDYSKGYLQGEKISYYNDGKTIKDKATIKNGKADGMVYRYSSDGKLEYEKGMKDGYDEGPEQHYDENGKVIAETVFINGKAEGKSFQLINKGSSDEYMITRYYKNSLLDGDYSEIFVKGNYTKTKGQYVNNKKNGKWIYGSENGKLYKEEMYDNGQLTNTKRIQ
jgi:antitoxin component YwqK of YwqJK toxin-antitoxin module